MVLVKMTGISLQLSIIQSYDQESEVDGPE